MTKFRGQVGDGVSSTNDTVRSVSPVAFRERLIHRLNTARTISQSPQLNSSPQEISDLENEKMGGSKASNSKLCLKDSREGKHAKWKFVRQKSQKMLNAFTSSSDGEKINRKNLPNSDPSSLETNATHTNLSSATTSILMHDFNLALSEYRSEVKENVSQLDTKINRLEDVIMDLRKQLMEKKN